MNLSFYPFKESCVVFMCAMCCVLGAMFILVTLATYREQDVKYSVDRITGHFAYYLIITSLLILLKNCGIASTIPYLPFPLFNAVKKHDINNAFGCECLV